MKKYSIWKDYSKIDSFNKLKSNKMVDVLIIGGGMTGINTMYHLRESSLEVLLVEQNKIGMGVTANSTGKLTFLQGNLYDKIINNFGEEKALTYLESQRYAMDVGVSIIKDLNIDCDLECVNSYVYSNSDKEDIKLQNLRLFLESNGIKVVDGDLELVPHKSVVGVENTYIFNPLKYIAGLVKVLNNDNIYEDTAIVKIEKEEDYYVAYTQDDISIKAKKIVIASHYPYFLKPMLFPIKGSLEKSYLSASKYKNSNVSLIKYEDEIISIRSYFDYLIYLSNSHNISEDVDDKKHFKELRKKLKDLNLAPEYIWSNVDIITNDGLPFVGEVKDNLYIGTGYNTWGMTNGILAGKILSDIILGIDNKYSKLFNPKRINLGLVGGIISDSYYSANGYIKGMITDNEKVKYKTIDGKEIAIYEDEKGVHAVYTKCPHLGCRLIFNEIELTWDCPCHASRFDIDGKCLSGPANEDINASIELEK